MIVSYRLFERFRSSKVEITFWDVGQGDSSLLKLPHGKNYLIDAGGGWENQKVDQVLIKELSRKGILKLNGIVMSHADSDHAQGFFGIFRNVQVERLFISGLEGADSSELERRIIGDAISREIKVEKITGIKTLVHDEIKLRLISQKMDSEQSKNNRSLIVELSAYGCKVLFTGDIEEAAERRLIPKLSSSFSVLKVPHHGSKTSSSWLFLKKIRPDFAVFSVGARNRYGHPRKEVIRRYRLLGSQVLRTDWNGFVQFEIDPTGKITCSDSRGSCGIKWCR